MAGGAVEGNSDRQRLFVLVDNGAAQGVFTSWDAAEAYADEHRFSLDHLMEYVTRNDHPDHLHLMAALWDDTWKFQGEWTKRVPRWEGPPKKVRLDHYHAKGNSFELFRQKEFDWVPGLLDRVNPMAPDNALSPDFPPKAPTPVQAQWKPKLTPLKPLPATLQEKDEEPAVHSLSESDEPDLDSESAQKSASTPVPSEPVKENIDVAPKKSLQPPLPKPQPSLRKPILKSPIEETDRSSESVVEPNQPKISFNKRQPLRLKSKAVPQPIPSFKPTVAHTDPIQGKSTVELAYADLKEAAEAAKKAEEPTGSPRRIWSLRLIFSVAAIFLCWGGGLYWVLRPEPTAASLVATVNSLNNARKIILEPDLVFFQMEVEPNYQQRWIQSLNLSAIPENQILSIPTYHALDTWGKTNGFVRPPYAMVEVDEWWDLRLRKIQYGFTYNWEDGSILILDLESDLMVAWAHPYRLPEILN